MELFSRLTNGRLWSSSAPAVKKEEYSDEISPQDESSTNYLHGAQENTEQDTDHESQKYDISDFGDQEELSDHGLGNDTISKANKPRKKKRKRPSKEILEPVEVETPQWGDENSLEEPSQLDVDGESTINEKMEETLVEERFVEEGPSEARRRRKANGTAPKRKRASKSKAIISPEDGAAMDEEGDERETSQLTGATQRRKSIKHVEPQKSRQTVLDPDLKPQSMDNGESESMTRTLSMQDLSDLPQRIKKAKKSKARRVSDGSFSKLQEDNDSAAVLHQPLSAAYVLHARAYLDLDTQETNLAASSQLQRDARLMASPEAVKSGQDRYNEEVKRPSKKALGKRKAINEPLIRGSNKKTKDEKNREPAGRHLGMFGFMPGLPDLAARLYEQESQHTSPEITPTYTSQPSLPTPKASWNAINNPVEPNGDGETGQPLFVQEQEERENPEPQRAAPKSSSRKRRLHTDIDESGPSNSTPMESQPTTAKSRAKTPKTPKAKKSEAAKQLGPGTSTKGKLSSDELGAISSAVESYRIHFHLTKHQLNELIQSDAQLKVAQAMWKSICDEVPHLPRRSVQNTCRRKFHNFEARGAWTEEQDDELRTAYDKHPGKWKLIGETLNRFPEDVRDRWRNYLVCGDTLKMDAWDIEEEERLRGAVRDCIQEARENNRLSGNRGTLLDEESLIDWQKVSENMCRTRSRLQCRNKWKKLKDRAEAYVDDPIAKMPISESWRLEEAASQARLFSAEEKLALLRAIRDSGAAREGKIPWQTFKDDLNGQGKRMAWKYCFRKLRDRVPGHKEIDFKDIVAHLVDVFETAAPDEPHGFDLPVESFPPYTNPNKKKSQAEYRQRQRKKNDNSAGPSTPRKVNDLVRKQIRNEDSDSSDGKTESASTLRRRRVRDRMLKEGESEEPTNNHDQTSFDIDENVMKNSKLIERSPTKKGKRVIRKSKRNHALSEEKVIEDPSDDEEALIHGNVAEANDYYPKGSSNLDTPIRDKSLQKIGSPVHLNGFAEDENASVSSDGYVSDIPARRLPREESPEL